MCVVVERVAVRYFWPCVRERSISCPIKLLSNKIYFIYSLPNLVIFLAFGLVCVNTNQLL
jgi:hypothetical protein